MSADYAVLVVTHDSEDDLPGCLDAIRRLDPAPQEVILVDCASRDRTIVVSEGFDLPTSRVAHIHLEENLGFAGGMNRAFAGSSASWVLTLNPDARPEPDYVGRLLDSAAKACNLKVGCVTGRLTRPADHNGEVRLDACGMRLVPTWRHLDRGSGEVDIATEPGLWKTPERVFGATGAASLFSRRALEDTLIEGVIFDPWFFAFREDAELAFRLQARDWDVLYEPSARCEHRRFNLPERRSEMPAVVNFHSLKNRYLLRIYHQTVGNFLWTLPMTLWRDALALGYVLLRERSSLAAYRWLWQRRRAILDRRRTIQARRTAPARRLDRWFVSPGQPI